MKKIFTFFLVLAASVGMSWATPNSIVINGTPQVGDNSISLTYYFDTDNVDGFDNMFVPTLKVKCVTDDVYDEKWLSNSGISSGTETITLDNMGGLKAGKTYYVCFAYKTGDWVDDVFQLFSFDPTAIDDTEADTKAVKRIVDGQLLIERDGKTYNAQGVEVR